MGLDCCAGRVERARGRVGSGVLYYADQALPRVHGTDLTLAEGLDRWSRLADGAFHRRGSAGRHDLPAAHFDAIVCLSVLEHIADADGAARGWRARRRGGTLVTGYPCQSRS